MFSNRNIFIATIVLLVGFMQIMYPIPSPLPTNQLFMILASILVLIKANQGGVGLSLSALAFFGTIVLSIAANDIPEFFKPWSRFMQFAFLFIAASPLFHGGEVDRVRRQMAMGVLWSAGIISIWSFAGYVLGFGMYNYGGISGYMGVTGHPNFLSMYVMVTMVWLSALFFRCTEKREYVIIASLWAMCLIVLLTSASRGSLAAGLVGSIIVIYLRLRRSASKLVTAGVVIAILTILAMPYLMPYAETMLKKDVNNETLEDSFSSTRGYIWALRYMELRESPVVGIGAYSCDIELPMAETFYSASNGSIELGSSYLGMLSQQGWLGFIAYLFLVVPIAWKTFRYATVQQTPYAQLMFGLLVAISSHMAFEGYAITAGAVQCVILWFVVGAASQCDKVADYPILWEKEDPITPDEYAEWREQQEDM